MALPLRMVRPRRDGLDGVLAMFAVAAVVALSVTAGARRRVGRRLELLRPADGAVRGAPSAEQALAEPVAGT